MKINRMFQDKDIKIVIKENDMEVIHCMNQQTPYFLAIDVRVYCQDVLINEYFRNFTKQVNIQHYNRFIQKFLEDSAYRQQFLVYGNENWEGVISYEEKQPIHPKCLQDIQALNKRKSVFVQELLSLKTYGTDCYSGMQRNELKEKLNDVHVKVIESTFSDKKLQVAAMRWVARGLRVAIAIKKIEKEVEFHINNQKRSV